MEDTARLALVEQCLPDTRTFTSVLYELLRFINNILENPHDNELRIIKSEILKKELKVEAVFDYLKHIGFEAREDQLSYPKEQTLSRLRMAQAAIERKIGFCSGTLNYDESFFKTKPNQVLPKKPKLTPSIVLNTRNPLLLKIEALFNNMIKYEDEDLQQFARNEIPIVKLQLMAIDRVREHQQKIKAGEVKNRDLPFDIALLMELLGWFKHKFFKWVDKPDCERCGGPTKMVDTISSRAGTEYCLVEVFQCNVCPGGSRFPRHNCVRTLLSTRRGRCGEWANCFTLLCRSLGYDTRYVYDTTDHVWCEVFDYDSNTWLHVDPCEGKLNTPLLYSHGWGKKISYVIAVSRDDIQDVTWRYTSDHKQVLKRRNLCDEAELIAALLALREQRQKQVSEPRRKYLAKRCAEELVQLMVERSPSSYESIGRISGSKEWRTTRGEVGPGAGHTFRFNGHGTVSVEYMSAEDEYRISDPQGAKNVIKTWEAGVCASKNIIRKLEEDWRKVYLAREESDSPGWISWRLQAESGVFTTLRVRTSAATYRGGKVAWLVQYDQEMPEVVNLGETPLTFNRRFKTVEIRAELSGGEGELAWQHAQLFRAPAPPPASPATPSPTPTPALLLHATIERYT